MEFKIVNKKLIKEFGTPEYGSEMAAGFDLRTDRDFTLQPNETITVGTGIAVNIMDKNIQLKLYPRSGMGSKGLVLGNLTGVIDSDYQGEVKACLWNRTDEPISYSRGQRVLQGVFEQVVRVTNPKYVSEFSTVTERGDGGFGSTGSN